MSTSTLLRQAIYELEAALDVAAHEYGPDSNEATLVADALDFLRNWMRHYAALHQPGGGP
jgi:hypothetical protein